MAVAIPAEMIAIISAMHRPKWARAPGRLDNKDPVAGHAVPTGHSFTTSMPVLDPLTLTCGTPDEQSDRHHLRCDRRRRSMRNMGKQPRPASRLASWIEPDWLM